VRLFIACFLLPLKRFRSQRIHALHRYLSRRYARWPQLTDARAGFIVLEHDLFEQTVELATGYILPDALARTNPKLDIMPISQCLGLPLTDAYVETNDNKTHPSALAGACARASMTIARLTSWCV
jgi:hypothetical protein